MGDETGGDEGANGAADAVGPVQEAERCGAVGEVGAEDVVHGEGEGHAEAEEEEGDDYDGEGRFADEHYVGGHHDGLGQNKHSCAA